MFYNASNNYEYNDCVAMGACSISPNISSMQEVMMILLRQIAYYLIKLRDFDIVKPSIILDVITQIASGDAVKDLSEVQVLNAFSKEYNNLISARKEYLQLCKKNNKLCVDLKHLIKLSPKTSLSAILKMGDKEFLQKFKKMSEGQKYLSEILTTSIKSVCINVVILYDYGIFCEDAINVILDALNLFNKTKINSDVIKNMIKCLASEDINILKLINKVQKENFGQIEKTEVSHSTSKNKAIMVSGSNLNDLKNVLLAANTQNIDVYTNGNLLIAHSFPYFKQFKNLKGHFGTGVNSTILDFATFPGAILLTKNEAQNIEYLYRGRLFTTDKIAPKGVVKIENNDFTPLINSAQQAKGFAKGQNRQPEIVGYNENELDKIIDKIRSTKPEKLYIIGLSSLSFEQKNYFKKFYSIIDKSDVVITFSYNPQLENVYAFNLGNDYSLLYEVLHKLFSKISLLSDNVVFFLTKCDTNSLTNIINLKSNGAKNIFLSDCPPTVFNPAVLRSFVKLFDIKNMTNPKEDLKT